MGIISDWGWLEGGFHYSLLNIKKWCFIGVALVVEVSWKVSRVFYKGGVA